MSKDDSLRDLIERVERGERSNELDVLIEVALFKPDDTYESVRANNVGTKVIYTTALGFDRTCWAQEHTVSPTITLAALRAHMGTGG